MKPMGNFIKCISVLFAVFFAVSPHAQSSNPSQTLQYKYDELGRLTTTEDSKNGDRVYNYDPAGNRTLVTAGVSSSSSTLSGSSGSSLCAGVSLKIEAENYSSMFGVQSETTTDVGGGKNLGYMHPGDWMLYENAAFSAPVSAIYRITFRLASTAGGVVRLHEADGSFQYGTIQVPVTGALQTWVDVTKDIFLNAGSHKFGMTVEERAQGFNINWFKVESLCGSLSSTSFTSSSVYNGGSASSSSRTSFSSSSSIAGTSSSRSSSSIGVTSFSSSSSQRSSSSQSSGVDNQLPSVPGAPIVMDLGANSASFSWGVSTDNVGVKGYEYSLNNGSWMPAGSAPSLILFALTSAANYTIKVRAFDEAGNKSQESNPTSFTTLDNVPPSAPGTVSLLSATHGKAKLSWLPATDNVAVGNYEYTIDAGVTWTKTNNQLTASLSGLIIGQPYTFTVRAIDASNNAGDGAPKNFVVTRLPAPTVSPPQLIQNCAWRATWEPVAGASKYLLAEAINGGTYSRYVDSSPTVTQCPEGQPDAGKPKEVSACDDNGCGLVATFSYYAMPSSSSSLVSSSSRSSSSSSRSSSSSSRSSSSSSSSSSVDTQLPSAPGVPVISSITGTSATASWGAATDNVGVVAYEYRLNNGSWISTGTSRSVTLTGLTSYTNYSLDVQAKDAAGNNGPSSSASFRTLDTATPSAPGVPVISAITGTSATASWSAATDDVGIAIYEYKLGNGNWISTGTSRSVTLTGLTPYTTYSFVVQAKDAAGNIGPSNGTSFKTLDTIQPSAPGTPSVSNNINGGADLIWSAATDNVGVVGYEYSLNSGTSWTPNGNSLSVKLSGLTVGQSYNFSVRAFDAAGYRGDSSSTNFSSIKKLPPPAATASVTANCVWTTTWSPVAGATSYKLTEFSNGQTNTPRTVTSPAYTQCPLNNQRNAAYPIEIQACNADGCSAAAAVQRY